MPLYRSPVRMTFLAVADAGTLRPDGRSALGSRRRPVGMLTGMSAGISTGRFTRSPMRGMRMDRVRPFCASATDGNSNRQRPAPFRGDKRMVLIQRRVYLLRTSMFDDCGLRAADQQLLEL